MAIFTLWKRSLPQASQKYCPVCEGKMLEQANQLVEAGFYVAAVATARCELEARLRSLTKFVSNARGETMKKGSLHLVASYLHNAGIINTSQLSRTDKVCHRAGTMLHNYTECNCIRARFIVREVEKLIKEIDDVVSSVEFSLWSPQLRKEATSCE